MVNDKKEDSFESTGKPMVRPVAGFTVITKTCGGMEFRYVRMQMMRKFYMSTYAHILD